MQSHRKAFSFSHACALEKGRTHAFSETQEKIKDERMSI